MKIALIAPGLMPIPPKGWGAVESIVWRHYEALVKRGHEVSIFNNNDIVSVILELNKSNFDFIHVQYDNFASYFLKLCTKPYCITSHYGYIKESDNWSNGYFSIFSDFLGTPGIICLSQEIKKIYEKVGYTGKLYVLPNGIDVGVFSFNNVGNGKVLCLGKIEPRKKQALLAKMLDGKVTIDFIGPFEDKNFISGKTCIYRGSWNKEEVLNNLTNYSVLLLASAGEAAPMVVVEALAAGLSVVISESSAANIDRKKNFITVVPDNAEAKNISDALTTAITKNHLYRNKAREYARNNFDNKIIIDKYEKIIIDFVSKKGDKKQYLDIRGNFIRKNFLKYIYSRIWLKLSSITILRRIKHFFNK